MGTFVGHTSCDNCGGSDPVAVYQNEKGEFDGTCFSCGTYYKKINPNFRIKKKIMTTESFDFVNDLPIRGWRERRVDKNVSELYNVRSEMNGETVLKRYYPVYTNNTLSGYKVRNCVEKGFRSIGTVGKHSELFGQNIFSNNGKYLVITEGEEDAMSAFSMLSNPKYRTPCVSITNGAQGAVEQIRANYNFVSGYEHVIICFDNDNPGQEAAEAVARILKPGQAKIMKMRLKDANQYMMSGQQKEFAELFWKAERYSPAGIVGSSDTWTALVSRANFVKIGLPAFAEDLEKMLNGGISLSEITTIFAACVDGDTEFLSPNGWIKISEYNNQPVMVFNPENRTSYFEVPENYINQPSQGLFHMKTLRGVDQVLSLNHKVPFLDHENRIQVKTFAEIKENHEKTVFHGKFIQTFNSIGGTGIGLSVFVKPDGCININKSSNESLWNASLEEREDVAFYIISHYSRVPFFYTQTKEEADFIQYAFATIVIKSNVSYENNVWVITNYPYDEDVKPTIEPYLEGDGNQYCFTTSTGMWLARRNGKIFVTGNSGVGKSTITYEFIYHWIFNTDYKIGIISLENDLGELIENLLSIHLNKKLAVMDDELKLKFFETEEAKKAHRELTTLPDGTDRFIILDHQGDMLEGDLQAKMEYLVRVNGCKILVLDPMTLALSGRGNDSTDQFMAWLVAFVKREQVCHINVVHVRKAQSGSKAGSVGGTIHEEDGRGCLDRETEFLSPDGWIKIADWNGEKVAQWNNGVMEYVSPKRFLNLECKDGFYHFKNKHNVDMMLSKDHRMLLEIKGQMQVKTAEDIATLKRTPRAYIPSTWISNNGLDISDEIIRVMVMCAADGHYHGNGLCKLEVKKQRKVDRVFKLLKEAEIPFSFSFTKKGTHIFRFKALSKSKDLDKCANWYQASTHQLAILVEESIHWDGSDSGDKGRSFVSTKPEEAKIVQFAAHSCGLVSRIHVMQQESYYTKKPFTTYTANVSRPGSMKSRIMIRENFPIEKVASQDGRMYCFEVDSGFFIARRNGKIFVTGNSSSIFQNSMNNILIMRDKENEDPEVRNTTRVVLSKSRRTGVTGPAGFWKYNNATSRLEKGRDPNGNYDEEEKDFIPFYPKSVEHEDF